VSALMTAPRRSAAGSELGVSGVSDDGSLNPNLSPEDQYALEVGWRIRQARKEVGLTQVQLAQKVGVSQRAAQAWETGEVIPYRWTKQIGKAVKRDPEWILHGEEADEDVRLERLETKVDELTRLLRAVNRKLNASK
jgi:DNA-binding XRE family transcriptional regulator